MKGIWETPRRGTFQEPCFLPIEQNEAKVERLRFVCGSDARYRQSRVQHQHSDAARCHMATEQLGDLVIGDDGLDLFSLPVPNDLYVLAPMHWFYF
jgi:hypothetical protein